MDVICNNYFYLALLLTSDDIKSQRIRQYINIIMEKLPLYHDHDFIYNYKRVLGFQQLKPANKKKTRVNSQH